MAAGRIEGLAKTFTAGGTINSYRLVKFGADDLTVIQATAATDASIGVAKVPQGQRVRTIQWSATPPSIPAVTLSTGERVDIVLSGIAEIEFGGVVARGDLLTSDANGKAIVAAPGAGVNARIIGIAGCSGVSGDIGTVMISPSQIKG